MPLLFGQQLVMEEVEDEVRRMLRGMGIKCNLQRISTDGMAQCQAFPALERGPQYVLRITAGLRKSIMLSLQRTCRQRVVQQVPATDAGLFPNRTVLLYGVFPGRRVQRFRRRHQ